MNETGDIDKTLTEMPLSRHIVHCTYREGTPVLHPLFTADLFQKAYCKSTNFGVLLYLVNLAICVFSLIFVAANIYVDRTLHRRAARKRQI